MRKLKSLKEANISRFKKDLGKLLEKAIIDNAGTGVAQVGEAFMEVAVGAAAFMAMANDSASDEGKRAPFDLGGYEKSILNGTIPFR